MRTCCILHNGNVRKDEDLAKILLEKSPEYGSVIDVSIICDRDIKIRINNNEDYYITGYEEWHSNNVVNNLVVSKSCEIYVYARVAIIESKEYIQEVIKSKEKEISKLRQDISTLKMIHNL